MEELPGVGIRTCAMFLSLAQCRVALTTKNNWVSPLERLRDPAGTFRQGLRIAILEMISRRQKP